MFSKRMQLISCFLVLAFCKRYSKTHPARVIGFGCKKQGVIFSDSKGEENFLASVGITNNMVNKSQLGKCVYTYTVSSENAGFLFSIFSEHLVVGERVSYRDSS